MSWLSKIIKKAKLPPNLNSVEDIQREAAVLAELVTLIRKAAANPTDLAGWLRLRDKAQALGLL